MSYMDPLKSYLELEVKEATETLSLRVKAAWILIAVVTASVVVASPSVSWWAISPILAVLCYQLTVGHARFQLDCAKMRLESHIAPVSPDRA